MTNLFAIRLYPISGDNYYFIGVLFIETRYMYYFCLFCRGARKGKFSGRHKKNTV